MKQLDQRFEALKRKIAGNQEFDFYQMVQGPDGDTRSRRTGLTPANNRLLAQLQFSLRLTDRLDSKYDALISQVLDYLEAELKKDGALVDSVCKKAEEMMLPMSADAKEYTIILAAHSHIDVNWLWDWPETVALTLDTFRTMLHMMEEYPQFCFSQSQGALYKIVEDYDPEMKKVIEQRIQEGRWEVTASAWVENDKNMPSTESQLRHMEYTHEYMNKVWGVPKSAMEIDFSPDTFGHSEYLPEIYAAGDVKYAYYCRGCSDPREHDDFVVLHRWRAPSGTEVLAYREPYWYGGSIYPVIGAGVFELESKCAGLKTSLYIFGVGDHGGGPSRRDIEVGMEMQTYPVFPTVKFGTITEFFKDAEAVYDLLPVVDGQLNYANPGCYTSVGKIKMGNRRTENALIDAEAWTTIASTVLNKRLPTDLLRKSWLDVLCTHFHDVLTGTCIEPASQYAVGKYADAQAAARSAHANATRLLSESVDTSSIETDDGDINHFGAGAGYAFSDDLPIGRESSGMRCYHGVPNVDSGYGKTRIYVVFNPLPYERECIETLTVWDWAGLRERLYATDHQGNEIPFVTLDRDTRNFWDHHAIRVLVKVKVPAMGYTTVVLKEREIEKYPTYFGTWGGWRGTGTSQFAVAEAEKAYVLENEKIRAEFDPFTGCLKSLIDKGTGFEAIDSSRMAGLELEMAQFNTNSAWNIGNICEKIPVRQMLSRGRYIGSTLRSSLVFEYQVLHSVVRLTISLDAGASRLKYHFNTIWKEICEPPRAAALSFFLPLNRKPDHYRSDVPAGFVDRSPLTHDVPALSYTAAIYGDQAVSFINDARYGYFCDQDSITLRLINTARHPDPLSEVCEQDVCFYLSLEDSNPASLAQTSDLCNHPVNSVSVSRHHGILPIEGSFLQAQGEGIVYTCLRESREGQLEMRYFNTASTDSIITVRSELMNVQDSSGQAKANAIGSVIIPRNK